MAGSFLLVALVLSLAKQVLGIRADLSTSLESSVPSSRTAVFALGSFWRAEAAFGCLRGVMRTTTGYTGGSKPNPEYQSVGDHAEAVEIEYNPRLITYDQLLDAFWSNHDPTQFFGQGPDVGSQYRSAIFFNGTEQEKLAYASKKRNQANLVDGLLTTEIKKLGAFYPAESEHQKFELRRKRPILQVFGDVADEEFLRSHAATKLNAYAAGMCPLSTQRQLDNMMDTILKCRTNAWKMFINAVG